MNGLELYDTTTFNDVIEALDTGKTIYLFTGYMYVFITSFNLFIDNNSHIITLNFNGDSLIVYPSEGYDVSDLYTPSNINFRENAGSAT